MKIKLSIQIETVYLATKMQCSPLFIKGSDSERELKRAIWQKKRQLVYIKQQSMLQYISIKHDQSI